MPTLYKTTCNAEHTPRRIRSEVKTCTVLITTIPEKPLSSELEVILHIWSFGVLGSVDSSFFRLETKSTVNKIKTRSSEMLASEAY